MKKAVVVSFCGTGNAGGVERVSQYVCQILEGDYEINVLEKANFTFPKIDFFVQAILMSIHLAFAKHDLLVSNSWQSFLYPADISFSHGTQEGYCRKIGKFKKFSSAGLMAHMEKIAAKKARKIIAVSGHVKNELVSFYGIDEKKIHVLPNCVDDSLYVPSTEPLGKNKKVILFSGRLEYGKGIESLASLSGYLEKISGWELHIAANTHQNEQLFSERKNTKLLFGLSSEEMSDFYKSGDILYFPSLYEGFSMATLEALSSGIPVIGTDYVVSEELKSYDFCRNCSDFIGSPEKIIEAADRLYEKWHGRKNEIHGIIARDFGIRQWKEKFMAELQND